MYRVLSVTVLSTILFAEEPTFELLDQFTGISDDGRTTESCAYDTVNNEWIFLDQNMGQIDFLPGSYPLTPLESGDFMAGINTTVATLGTMFVAGSENLLYIACAADSSIATYNVDTDDLTLAAIDITNDAGFGTNGLCYDADNDVLYATAVGIDFNTFQPVTGASGIWKIASPSAATPTITRIPTTDVPTQNATELYDVYRPNGCTVVGGMVYFVETRLDIMGALGIYDIAADEFTVNTEILTEAADGLIAIDNYLILSAWGSWVDAEMKGHLSYYDLDMYPEGMFMEGITGFVASADIAYQPSTGIICVPSLNEGTVEFVQFTAPEVLVSSTMEPEPTEGDNANNMSAVIGMIAACLSYVLLN